MMRVAHLFFVVIALLHLSAGFLWAQSAMRISLAVTIRDTDDTIDVAGGTATIRTNVDSIDTPITAGSLKTEVSARATGGHVDVTVILNPPNKYRPRKIPLRLICDRCTGRLSRDVHIFVAPSEHSYDLPELVGTWKSRLDAGQTDKALAVFEAVCSNLRADRIGEFEIVAKTNYARALLEACRTSGYSTCELAAQVCQDLGRSLEENKRQVAKILKREPLPRNFLADCQRDVATRTAQLEWHEIQQSYQTGGEGIFLSAKGMEGLLEQYDTRRVALMDNGLTKSFLAREGGIAYIRYGDDVLAGRTNGTPTDARAALLKGRQLLLQVTRVGSELDRQKVKEGLALAKVH